jgi:Ca2+-binding RTX toxin-like protein
LYGGLGNDVLNGGAGQDSFVFNTKLGSGNVDRIVGFNVVDDTIMLDDAVFKLTTGAVNGASFHVGAAAHDSSDRIIYNANTGALLYDSDGTGWRAPVQFATLDPGLAVTHADFYVV